MDDYDGDNMDEEYQIKLANSCESILDEVKLPKAFVSTKSPEETYSIKCVSAMTLSFAEQEEIFQLTQKNMKKLYEESGFGWQPIEKRNELFHPLSRIYAIIDDKSNHIAAFAVFRFDFDDEEDPEFLVLYLYELQVRDEYQRRGLGTKIVLSLKDIANHFRMRKVILTCLKLNVDAMQFYTHLGFKIDRISPSQFGHDDVCYEILSSSAFS